MDSMDIDMKMSSKPVSNKVNIVNIQGEIDIYNSPSIKNYVIELMAEGYSHIILNINDVKFIDSTGLGMLIGLLKRLGEKQGALSLVCNNSQVLKLFYLTGLEEIFNIHPSEKDAINGVSFPK